MKTIPKIFDRFRRRACRTSRFPSIATTRRETSRFPIVAWKIVSRNME